MLIKKGMLVRVIRGNHRGSDGKVLRVFPDRNRVIIEGINFIKRASRPTQENPSGGFIEKEASIHVSNVMVLRNNEPTRIGFKVLDDGLKVRVAKKTGEELESK